MTGATASGPTPLFIPGAAGRLFSVWYPSPAGSRKGVLFFPPFAEEMNKSRRMAALAARRLSASGYSVLMPDLFGTGDSEGDFVDARWSTWRDDMAAAVVWMQDRGVAEVSFLALRSGALLASDTAAFLGQTLDRLVLWAPVLNGDLFISQFLRLKLAAGVIAGQGGPTTKELRAALAGGDTVEVAGYELAPELVERMAALNLRQIPPLSFRGVHWFEVAAEAGQTPGPAVSHLVEAWSAARPVSLDLVVGDAFWNTTEITVLPALIDATVGVFDLQRAA